MLSDEQLMLNYQGGSAIAFEELFFRYRNTVYGFFRRRLPQAARAEELAQETFLIVIRDARTYLPSAKFRTYLFGIALKQLWTERRKALRERNASAETMDTPKEKDPTVSFYIRDALSRIDSDHREVLMLREYEQLAYEEIGQLLEIPLNTVRSRLFRARSELRTLLQERSVEGVPR
jgi:RNA polymerase sigma-70 factor (ECF subfamily)